MLSIMAENTWKNTQGGTLKHKNKLEMAIYDMNKILRAYKKDSEADNSRFKTLLYFYQIYINYLKLESNLEIEKRIEALEDRLSQNQVNNTFTSLKKAYGIKNNEK